MCQSLFMSVNLPIRSLSPVQQEFFQKKEKQDMLVWHDLLLKKKFVFVYNIATCFGLSESHRQDNRTR